MLRNMRDRLLISVLLGVLVGFGWMMLGYGKLHHEPATEIYKKSDLGAPSQVVNRKHKTDRTPGKPCWECKGGHV